MTAKDASAAEKVPAFKAVGVDGIVVNMPNVADLTAVAKVGEALAGSLA
jgi:hypothetical protein